VLETSYADKNNERIDIVLHVHDVQIESYPEDEELSKLEGFTSLPEMKEAFFSELQKVAENEKESHMCDTLVSKMIDTGKIEPIPYSWLLTTAKKMQEQYINELGCMENVMKHLNVTDEKAVQRLFIVEAHRDLLSRIAFFAYAEKFKLKNETEVFQHFKQNVKWVYHDRPKINSMQ
jgi:hypothetical protein